MRRLALQPRMIGASGDTFGLGSRVTVVGAYANNYDLLYERFLNPAADLQCPTAVDVRHLFRLLSLVIGDRGLATGLQLNAGAL
jgi:hypothetical protein